MIRLMLVLPLLLGFAQDDAALQDLIKKLDDSSLEVREKALRDLVKLGPKALESLRKAVSSESAELRVRAEQAIRAIELEVKSREVCPPSKPFTLKKSGTVGEILDELARLSGTPFEAATEQRELKAAVDASTVFQALDQICAGRDSLTYSFADDGKVKFQPDRHPASPAGYFEAFKISLTETNVLRKTDYKEPTITARISLQAAWESRLKPLKRVQFQFETSKDDAGRDVEIVAASMTDMFPVAGGGIFMAAGFGEESDSSGPQTFGLKGLSPEAKSLASLKGSAKVFFPISRVEVSFEDPEKGNNKAVGDLTIRLSGVSSKKNMITVKFGKSKGDITALAAEITDRLAADSVRAVDEDGKEHVGEFTPAQRDPAAGMVIIGGPGGDAPKTTTFQASFPTLEGKEFKRFKFRIAEALFEKVVPFEIKDIKLP